MPARIPADDRLFRREAVGGAGDNDWLHGGERGERIRGHRGDDTLIGGAGNDTLVGGAGADVFVFDEGGVFDFIADFGVGDRILIEAPGLDRFDDLAIAYSDGDACFHFTTAGGLRQIVIVLGVGEAGLDAGDFLFG